MTDELLRSLPKSDLHVHLDGSLRLATLIELAKEEGVALPSYSESGLQTTVFKPRYESLEAYLKGFDLTCAVLRTPEALERVAYELCLDAQTEGVRYLEIRYAPQLLAADVPSALTALQSVAQGCERAEHAFNHTRSPDDIPFHWGIICCAMRNVRPAMSPYYRALHRVLPASSDKEFASLLSTALVRLAIDARDRLGIPIVGIDLAGAENGYPPKTHERAFSEAHAAFLRKTVHAGEGYGPESIYEAITRCHAERIGHGTSLFSADAVQATSIANPRHYVRSLVEYIASRRITLEVCPTSNFQTIPELDFDIARHPIARMIEANLSVAVCTDNRLVSATTLTKELRLVIDGLGLNQEATRRLLLGGFKAAFFPGSYAQKRQFVAAVSARLDALIAPPIPKVEAPQ